MTPRLTRLAVAAALILPGAAPAAAAADNPWLERPVLNIAHQGGEDEFPSNTMYAFREALRAGADMLELDVGVTRDGHVVVSHDTTLDRTTSGRGAIAARTLRQVGRVDAAHWFAAGSDAYRHDRRRSAYRFRGIATGDRRPPAGYRAADFRVPTLREVLKAFPRTPINVEIKGRTPAEKPEEYVRNAEALARVLRGSRRRDIIVVSFQQAAVDRFHQLAPRIPVAPGITGAADYLLAGRSPGAGVVALQLPTRYTLGGQSLEVTTPERIAKAHADGYAWHIWLSDEEETPASWRRMLGWCADGIMTARPRALERVLRADATPPGCR